MGEYLVVSWITLLRLIAAPGNVEVQNRVHHMFKTPKPLDPTKIFRCVLRGTEDFRDPFFRMDGVGIDVGFDAEDGTWYLSGCIINARKEGRGIAAAFSNAGLAMPVR